MLFIVYYFPKYNFLSCLQALCLFVYKVRWYHTITTKAGLNCSIVNPLRKAVRAGLIACVTAIFQNTYTDCDISYLNAKGFDVFIWLKNRVSGEIHVKSQIPHDEVKNYLCKEQWAGEENIWISQKNKDIFSRTPGNICDIVKDSNRVQLFASTLMAFWKKISLGVSRLAGEYSLLGMNLILMFRKFLWSQISWRELLKN